MGERNFTAQPNDSTMNLNPSGFCIFDQQYSGELERVVWSVVVSLSTLGMITNSTFLYAMKRTKTTRLSGTGNDSSMKAIDFFLINLGIADLCYSFMAILRATILEFDALEKITISDNSSCRIVNFFLESLGEVPFLVSIFCVLFISVERYLAICKPFLKSSYKFNHRLQMLAAWVLALLIASLIHGLFSDCAGPLEELTAVVISYVLSGLYSFVIIIYLIIPMMYILIFREMNRRHKSERIPANLRPVAEKEKDQVVKMLSINSGFFFILTGPQMVIQYIVLLAQIIPNCRIVSTIGPSTTVWLIIWCCFQANSAINPFVYTIFSETYRQAYKDALPCYAMNPEEIFSRKSSMDMAQRYSIDTSNRRHSVDIWHNSQYNLSKI